MTDSVHNGRFLQKVQWVRLHLVRTDTFDCHLQFVVVSRSTAPPDSLPDAAELPGAQLLAQRDRTCWDDVLFSGTAVILFARASRKPSRASRFLVGQALNARQNLLLQFADKGGGAAFLEGFPQSALLRFGHSDFDQIFFFDETQMLRVLDLESRTQLVEVAREFCLAQEIVQGVGTGFCLSLLLPFRLAVANCD